jgi:hypothetical protein
LDAHLEGLRVAAWRAASEHHAHPDFLADALRNRRLRRDLGRAFPDPPSKPLSVSAVDGSVLAAGIPAFVRDVHASRLVEPIDG